MTSDWHSTGERQSQHLLISPRAILQQRRAEGCSPLRKASRVSLLGALHGVSGGLKPAAQICGVKMAALVASLVAGACLMAAAVASRDYAWLGWLCLLPLFFAIRACTPACAAMCGFLWGACLYVFLSIGTDVAAPTIPAFALLTGIPAFYAYLGARLTRWIGFSAFVLAVGWMGVELASAPLGLRYGLLAGTQGDGTLMAWIGQGLGYVLVAFIVAVVNASLVSALCGIRVKLPQFAYRASLPDRGASLLPQTFFVIPLFALCPSQPRAPPR